MKFQGQGFQTLEHEQDRQTHTNRQTRPSALPATFAGGNKKQSSNRGVYGCRPVRLAHILNNDPQSFTNIMVIDSFWP